MHASSRSTCRASILPAVLSAAALSLFAVVAHAQPQLKAFKAGPGPDELWDVTTKVEMPGMPMSIPAQTHQMCLKKDRKSDDMIPRQQDCKIDDVKTVGNRMTYTMVCTGRMPMTANGEVTFAASSYEGKMRMKSTQRGQEMDMAQTFSGKKVGACTAG